MLGDIQLMTTSTCDGLQRIHHSWPRASSLHCLSEGRTQLCSYSQSAAHYPKTWPRHMGVSVCARTSLAGQLLDVNNLSPLVRCAGVFHSYCLPRWHSLPCQFLIDTVSSQLMRPLAGWSGPGGPHLCSLGGIADIPDAQRPPWRRLCLVNRLGCFERFITVLASLMLSSGPRI